MQHPGHDSSLSGAAGRSQNLLEMLCSSAAAEYRAGGGEIFCAKGCSSCCTLAVNCTAGEALLLAGSLDSRQQAKLRDYIAELQIKVRAADSLKGYLRIHRRELGGCPFLDGGSCGVYPLRPLSCRALLSTRERRWCGVDFSELSSAEKQAFIDGLDRAAVAFPMHYLAASRDAGQELEAQLSLQMLQEYGFSLYGSMPVLVYLFMEYNLAELIGRGAEAVLGTAAAAGLASPFLLQVDTL